MHTGSPWAGNQASIGIKGRGTTAHHSRCGICASTRNGTQGKRKEYRTTAAFYYRSHGHPAPAPIWLALYLGNPGVAMKMPCLHRTIQTSSAGHTTDCRHQGFPCASDSITSGDKKRKINLLQCNKKTCFRLPTGFRMAPMLQCNIQLHEASSVFQQSRNCAGG